ncbi:MAG: hypothetical protein ACI80S_001213 [Pseudohongiellaceae bacterium]
MVNKITPPNTNSIANRTLNAVAQTRDQANNQSDANSPSGKNSRSINTTSNNVSTTTNVSAKTGANTASGALNAGNSSVADVRSVTNAIQQLPPNRKLTAQVTSSQALNDNEMALLKQINPSLMQQLTTARAAQLSNLARISSASDLQMNNSPLYLTKLAINATVNISRAIDSKILTTITLQTFNVGQTLILGQQNGQLQISAGTPLSLNLQEKLQQAASQTIRNVLPKQESISQLQQFTGQLSRALLKLPPSLQDQLASRSLIQALGELNRFTQTSMTLQRGWQVQQALANSGTSFEAKLGQSNHLAQSISNEFTAKPFNIDDNYAAVPAHLRASSAENSQANLRGDIRINLDKILSAINLSANNAPSNHTLVTLSQTDIDKFIDAVAAALNNSTSSAVRGINAPKNLTAASAALFRLLGIAIPFGAPTVGQLPKAIEQHLKKLVEQTQAKIQFNQLRSIGLDRPASESRANLQQFHTELPLRFNEQVLALQLSIHEQNIAKDSNRHETNQKPKDNDKTSLTRRWQVFLTFDLPNDEKLHTQLTIVESSISATLWAQSRSLCDRAQKDISWLRDKLLANGLTVEDITCLRGSPPQKGTSLDYNLVDINT